MTQTSDYGTLTDYVTGEAIRPATRDEWLTSIRAGETGAYRDDDGRDLFVAGGPESEADEHPTVTFSSREQAAFIAEMPQLAGNGHRLHVNDATVALTPGALDVLADLDDDNDGHFDGTHVWVGGTEYLVQAGA